MDIPCIRRFSAFAGVLLASVLLAGSRAAAQPANEPLEKCVVTDGIVNTMIKNGNVLYLGGTFGQAGVRTGGGVPVSIATGQAEAAFPSVNGSVYAAISDGKGGWYIGGAFSLVGGFVRTNLAHINNNRTVDANFAPAPSGGSVYTLALSAGTLYAGGTFTNANSQTRNYAAAFDAATGALNNWNPNLNGILHSIVLYGTNVYLGGEYTSVGGQGRNRLAAVDQTNGQPTAWNPNASDIIEDMVLSSGHLYVAGYFTGIMSATRSRAAAFDLSTGLLDPWDPNANGAIFAIDAAPGTIFLGGGFSVVGSSNRQNVAAVDAVSGLATSWDAKQTGSFQLVSALCVYSNTLYAGGSFNNLGGQPRLAAAALDLTTGNANAWDPKVNYTVNTFCGSGASIFLGGNFGAVGCVPRSNLAAFDLQSGQITSWNPVVIGRGGNSYPVQALAIAGSQLFVGGFYTNIGGATRTNLASVDLQTGAVSSWAPNPTATIDALATWNDRLFVGGTAFTSISGQARTNFAEYYLSDLTLTPWDPQIRSFVQALLVDGNTLYVGGSFSTVSGQTQRRVAAFDLTTDTLISWNPNFGTTGGYVDAIVKSGNQIYLGGYFSVVNGFNRTNFVAVDAATASVLPLVANADSYVYALAASSNQVFIGGNFGGINNQKRSELASMDLNSGNLTSWNPSANGFVIDMSIFDGVLYAGGGFFRAGGETTAGLAAFPLSLVGTPTIISNSIQRAPGGPAQFRVCALGVPQATVLSGTNLTDWQPLQVVPLVAGNGAFTDPDAPNHPRRFYRLRVP